VSFYGFEPWSPEVERREASKWFLWVVALGGPFAGLEWAESVSAHC
jgi:hypothetical protein